MKKKFKHNNLIMLLDHAKEELLKLPTTQFSLPGGSRKLSENEKIALAYFSAALYVIGEMDSSPQDIEFDFQVANSDPETE